ncbi:MAG: S8 family serine peptidase [Cyanobacteria bacterium P01_E01_bin.42]
MNKTFYRFSLVLLFSLFLPILGSNSRLAGDRVRAREPEELYYTFFDEKVPLVLREDAIAVSFRPQRRMRGEDLTSPPQYLQLQESLNVRTRGSANNSVEVTSLGTDLALVNIVSGNRRELEARIQQQAYVKSTLPVLSRANSDSSRGDDLILPNEIIITVAPGLSETEIQTIFAEHNIEAIRKLRFTQNRYLVRSTVASGIEVLNVAEQLNRTANLESASPNFIQRVVESLPSHFMTPSATKSDPAALSSPLLPMQWHLNSAPLVGCLDSNINSLSTLSECTRKTQNSDRDRTDVRALEAWKNSNAGEGAIVAVIDTLIQWNHSDLKNNIHSIGNISDKLPGEVYGWDFVDDDRETRISTEEFKAIEVPWRHAFVLEDETLNKTYPLYFEWFREQYPDWSEAKIAEQIRQYILDRTAGNFHGTMVAGVIAASPEGSEGVIGIAPNAKILPVRSGGVSGTFQVGSLVESIGYAAARGVDVINMSLGGQYRSQPIAEQIERVLEERPDLVIVASSGNDNLNAIGFPAALSDVISVGATNVTGHRASYSNYGTRNNQKLTLVAPGGDFKDNLDYPLVGGILTTGGTFLDLFWSGINLEEQQKNYSYDPRGKYRWTQGTSFSAPIVSGIVALIKGEDTENQLTRAEIIEILQETSSYEGLHLRPDEREIFDRENPNGSIEEYFFGSGLVNADAAIREAKRRLRK